MTKGKRSKVMSAIHSKDTVPERILRKALHMSGYRYSLKHKIGNIRPDMVLVSRKICIFIDGCFWHKCPKCYRAPSSNRKYWLPKIERNVSRDKEQTRLLKKAGWKVIRVWEHEIRKDANKTADRIAKKLERSRAQRLPAFRR